MKVTTENNELIIRIPMSTVPVPSASGKTLIVASSGGNQKTAVTVQGKQVVIGLNAYIPR